MVLRLLLQADPAHGLLQAYSMGERHAAAKNMHCSVKPNTLDHFRLEHLIMYLTNGPAYLYCFEIVWRGSVWAHSSKALAQWPAEIKTLCSGPVQKNRSQVKNYFSFFLKTVCEQKIFLKAVSKIVSTTKNGLKFD